MRLSSSLIYDRGLQGILDGQSQLTDTQERISVGQRILTPSDDPVASAQILRVEQEISITEQYQANTDTAENRLRVEETTLDAIGNSIIRIQELSVQANSGLLSLSDRRALAVEVRERGDEILGLLNTRDPNGEYVFAGFRGGNAPFEVRNGGGYVYNGDEGQREIQITSGNTIPVSDSGKALFVDIDAAENTFITSANQNNSGSGQISVGLVVDQEVFDQTYHDDYVIKFNALAPLPNYTVTRRSDGAPVLAGDPPVPLTNVTYTSGDTIAFNGIEFEITGNPNPGDSFFVNATKKQDLLTTIERLALAMEQLPNKGLAFPADGQTIGIAATPAADLATAGNNIANQQITIVDHLNREFKLNISAGNSANDIRAIMADIAGLTVVPDITEATLDVSATVAAASSNPGDTIQFVLNGETIRAQVDTDPLVTYDNIWQAFNTAFRPPNSLNMVNNNDGTFAITDARGNNVSIEDFQVVDNPSLTLSALANFDLGETINFDLIGSDHSVSVDVTVNVANDTADLASQITNSIASAGLADQFAVNETAGVITLSYLGDTDGAASISLENFTDSAGAAASMTVLPLAGTAVAVGDGTFVANSGDVETFNAIDVDASAAFSGAIGAAVTLTENAADSSAVAATFTLETAPEFQLFSSVAGNDTVSGGIFDSPADEQLLGEEIGVVFALIDAQTSLDNAQTKVLDTRAAIGSRLNTIDSVREINENVTIEATRVLSQIRDLDYAKAISDLEFQRFVLEAAQASYTRIVGLSLFNFL